MQAGSSALSESPIAWKLVGKIFEWHLADPTPLTERVEIAGRLGLYDVTELLADKVPTVKKLPKPKPPTKASREIHPFFSGTELSSALQLALLDTTVFKSGFLEIDV